MLRQVRFDWTPWCHQRQLSRRTHLHINVQKRWPARKQFEYEGCWLHNACGWLSCSCTSVTCCAHRCLCETRIAALSLWHPVALLMQNWWKLRIRRSQEEVCSVQHCQTVTRVTHSDCPFRCVFVLSLRKTWTVHSKDPSVLRCCVPSKRTITRSVFRKAKSTEQNDAHVMPYPPFPFNFLYSQFTFLRLTARCNFRESSMKICDEVLPSWQQFHFWNFSFNTLFFRFFVENNIQCASMSHNFKRASEKVDVDYERSWDPGESSFITRASAFVIICFPSARLRFPKENTHPLCSVTLSRVSLVLSFSFCRQQKK